MNISEYSSNLYLKDNIYLSKNSSPVSYPEDGNQHCFELEDTSYWFLHRNSCIVELVKHFAPQELFFDIGGGNGFVAKGLEDNGINTILVEPGLQGAINAKKRGLANVICSTFDDAQFRPGCIPSAGLFDVIEHISDDHSFLRSIHVLMEQNGLLFITVPAYKFLWSDEDKHAGHFRRYTLATLEKVLSNAGFKTLYSTYIFTLLPIPIFLLRTMPSYVGLAKESNRYKTQKNEHSAKSFSSLLDKIFRRELSAIKSLKRLPFGSSCLVVAQKQDAPTDHLSNSQPY